jgi:adenylate cyclase
MKKKLSREIWKWRGILIAVANATVIVTLLRLTGLLQFIEFTALDQFFLLRPEEPIDNRIVIVKINEVDIEKQGQWPISDAVLARLLVKIKEQKPRAIGLDIYRDLQVNPGNEDLIKVFSSTPNLIGIQKVFKNNDDDDLPIKPPPILNEKKQVGGNDLIRDDDGKVRRGLLYLYLENGDFLESLALKLALLYLNPEKITEEAAKTNPDYLQLGKGFFPRFVANDGSYVNTKDGSYQVILNYRGNIEKFPNISLTEVLENPISPDLMRGKVVLIGSTAGSLKDLFYTPYTNEKFATPRKMPGVVVHANLISQILGTALDNRPLIKSWSEPWEYLWIFVWSTIGATLSWQLRHNHRILTISIILAGCILIGGCFLGFIWGWWIPVVPPILTLGGAAIFITQYVASRAANMQRTFGRYLTDEVVNSLLEQPDGLKLGGERRKVTVLVSDLRGFSAISEEFTPEEVVNILNLYLESMTDIIHYYKGTINDFMGDGILVMFGAPISREDDSQRAIACAMAMQLAMKQVNKKNQEMNLPILEMGIGINTGEVVAGNIGSQKRAEYTVIGSHVNLAARIESYTVGGQVFISEHTYQDANIDLRIDSELQVEAKGIKYPINLYEVGGIGGKYQLFLATEQESIVSLKEELLIEYMVLEGKHIEGKLFSGALVGLSEHGAQLHSQYPLERLSNIKLKLLIDIDVSDEETDIYAKVVRKSTVDQNYFLIRFTSLPQRAIAHLNRIQKINPHQ